MRTSMPSRDTKWSRFAEPWKDAGPELRPRVQRARERARVPGGTG